MIFDLFKPSGGGLYHLRSFHRETLWQPFRDSINHWLNEWNPPKHSLILIGPSGGYTLKSNWLLGFRQVFAYDTDPLAPWFFRKRHSGIAVEFSRQNMFWVDNELTHAPMQAALQAHTEATILFSNVLGQIPIEHPIPEDQWRIYLQQLRTLLKGRTWASYHDLYSIDSLPQARHANIFDQLKDHGTTPRTLKSLTGSLKAMDHLMNSDWTTGLSKHRFPWSLSNQRLHIIEAIHD